MSGIPALHVFTREEGSHAPLLLHQRRRGPCSSAGRDAPAHICCRRRSAHEGPFQHRPQEEVSVHQGYVRRRQHMERGILLVHGRAERGDNTEVR